MSVPNGADIPSSRQPRSGQNPPTSRNAQRQHLQNHRHGRWLARATAAATVLGLFLAYLQVATAAHWFPFSLRVVSFVETLSDPSGPERDTGTPDKDLDDIDRVAWREQVTRVGQFFNDHPGKIVRLQFNIWPVHGRHIDVAASKKSSPGIGTIKLRVDCGDDTWNCLIVDINILQGPATELGYDEMRATRASVLGFYRIGRTYNQTGTTIVDVIPVDEPK